MSPLYLDADLDEDLVAFLAGHGHDALTTVGEGRRRAGDEEQLAFAAALGRILVTHNRKDFRLLQRAWRHWSDVWAVEPKPDHVGILVIPQPPLMSIEQAAREIDAIVRSGRSLTNRLHEWTFGRGWVQYG